MKLDPMKNLKSCFLLAFSLHANRKTASTQLYVLSSIKFLEASFFVSYVFDPNGIKSNYVQQNGGFSQVVHECIIKSKLSQAHCLLAGEFFYTQE